MLYIWAKVVHLVFMVAWFAGLFYIWRLYVYHNDSSDVSVREQLAVMEKKLYYIVMLPASMLTVLSGLYMLFNNLDLHKEKWFSIKLIVVLLLIAHHILAGYYRKTLLANKKYPAYFFRLMNEVPTLALIIVIIMVIVRPF